MSRDERVPIFNVCRFAAKCCVRYVAAATRHPQVETAFGGGS